MFLWTLGPALLNRALFGRFGIAPLAGAFFAYNANFAWGFLNYYFAAGLSLCLFAAWVATAHDRKPARTLAFALAALVVYFCHLFAAFELLILIASFEFSACFSKTGFDITQAIFRVRRLALIFLPAALAFLLRPRGATTGPWLFELMDSLRDRWDSLIFYRPSAMLPLLLFAVLVPLLLARRARLHRAMWLPLAVILLGTILVPQAAFGGAPVHLRLPAYFAALLFASIEILLPQAVAAITAALLLGLASWSAVTLTRIWRPYDRQVSEFRAALGELPPDVKLVTAMDTPADLSDNGKVYWHMAEYAILDRAALTSLMFVTKGLHVIELEQIP